MHSSEVLLACAGKVCKFSRLLQRCIGCYWDKTLVSGSGSYRAYYGGNKLMVLISR